MAKDREIISTNDAPRSPVYSQAVKAAGLIFVSGQGPFDPQPVR
jgi:2-iminobutanoate/2-iminopropanoate deaminase